MTATVKEPKQQSATVVAAQKIRQLIFSGELVPDSNHLESELANRLGMSRTPVREAALVLQAQGLLEIQPRKGIKIKGTSVQDMADIYAVLTELECLCARTAARAELPNKALRPMRDTIRTMDTALVEQNREAWALANEKFHLELVHLGENKHIKEIVSNVNDQVRRARSITLNMRPLPTKSNKDHRKLCQAILQGDAKLADEIHRNYLETVGDMLVEILNKAGLKRV
ncbi:UNVERIFIED_CONTAM: hypothetical protein GTU68_033500 [Idotea baltica]|nr:hypothetical protein [Idotea baltica]